MSSQRKSRLGENMDISRWQKAGGDRNSVGTCVSHVRGRAIGGLREACRAPPSL